MINHYIREVTAKYQIIQIGIDHIIKFIKPQKDKKDSVKTFHLHLKKLKIVVKCR